MKTVFDRNAAFESQMADFFNLLDQIFMLFLYGNRIKCMLIFLPWISNMQKTEILVPGGIQYRTR